MATELILGDETKLRMPNPFDRVDLLALRQTREANTVLAPVIGEQYREVRLEAVVGDSPVQLRAAFDPDNDTEDRALLESLSSDGQRLPVLLAEVDGAEHKQYVPLDGHRRLAALRRLERSTVKAVIVRAGSLECDLISLTANVRKNLAPLELARAVGRLKEQHGLHVDAITQRVGLARSYVFELLALAQADPAIVAAVEAQRISAKTAGVVLKAKSDDQPGMLKLAEECQLSEAQARKLLEEVDKHDVTPEQAALKLHYIHEDARSDTQSAPLETTPAPDLSLAPETRPPKSAPAPLVREEFLSDIRALFPEIDESRAAALADLAADHAQSRKVVRAACLLMLSNWDVTEAVEGAELSQRDPHARKIVAMLELSGELEDLLRQGQHSRECAPMLVGFIRRIATVKKLALSLKSD
jgi:ParB/RepB/Spo0J family partition protein